MNIKKLFNEFVICHDGTVNKLIHIVGFATIGVGIIEKSLFYVIAGGVIQESGHFYQYFKTKQYKYSPLSCLKPQSLFAYPIFILIILYVLFAR